LRIPATAKLPLIVVEASPGEDGGVLLAGIPDSVPAPPRAGRGRPRGMRLRQTGSRIRQAGRGTYA
jgi:hypothetical protein